MKNVLFCLSLLVSGAALAADPLADANALFEQKAYPQALQAYTKLANAGNPEAQQKLGQMYWYGEAGTVDQAKAEAWFSKAAAKGNKVAAASLELMKQRVARRAEIDHWTGKYDGADLTSGEFRCPAPRIPAVSKMNEEIDRVGAAVTAWQDCYNRFVANLNAASPLIKRIPPDVAKLMNKEEVEKARLHLEGVQANLTENAKVNAKLVLADFAVWRSATEAWVSEHNAIVKSAPKDSPAR
ncbi:MAG TPA: sel1 repeat family protein [Telluria sp.]